MNFQDSMEIFLQSVGDMLLGEADSKGYSGKENEGRDFFDSVDSECPGHAEGEIRYKTKRWQAKKNPEDLIKIAAWAFLIWDQHQRQFAEFEENHLGVIKVPDSVINEVNKINQAIGAPTICTHFGTNDTGKCYIGDCRCTCYRCNMEKK